MLPRQSSSHLFVAACVFIAEAKENLLSVILMKIKIDFLFLYFNFLQMKN